MPAATALSNSSRRTATPQHWHSFKHRQKPGLNNSATFSKHSTPNSTSYLQEADLDPGLAVAKGTPLLLRIYVPLWIMNTTSLPLQGLLSQISAPPKAAESEEEARQGRPLNAAENIKLRILEAREQLPDSRYA